MAISPGALVRLFTNQAVFFAPVGDLPGQGGYINQEDVNSGTINLTAQVGTAVLWNSSDAAPKTNYIPTSTGSKNIITIFDVIGTAYDYPITVTPLTGSIINMQNQLYTNFMSLNFYDSSIGWLGF